MKITKIDEQLSLRERMLKKVNEGIEDEIASEPVEAPEETGDEAPAEAPAEEPTDEVTISLTPEEVDILQKIVGMIDGSAGEPAEDVPAEVCPGCDDPNCPDCGGAGAEPEGDVDDVDPEDEPFEIPDLSGMTPDEDDSAYFG